MDMNNLQVAIPSTTTPESGNEKYTFNRPFRQRFSLPYPVIKYMIDNPRSGKVWKKLITSCKYFYPKYPVLPVESLKVLRDSKCNADGEIFDSSKPFPKLWVYDYFFAFVGPDISTYISKIFKFDLRRLYICYHGLKFNDYQKLTSSGSFERLDIDRCGIKNADGTMVTADKLFEHLKYLQTFTMDYPDPLMFQADAVKKMVQHFYRFENMRSFSLQGLTETFDLSSVFDFLMKNETTDIRLSFYPYGCGAYMEMVEKVVKEIKKNPLLKVPRITFFE